MATQDEANREAVGEIQIGLEVVRLPVTTLLFLEKKLVDVRTFISKLPTLDQAKQWSYDAANQRWIAEPEESYRTKKVMRNHVKAEATEHHPAQVEVYMEDVPVGVWKKLDFSSAIPSNEKDAMMRRVNTVIEQVKMAREAANEIEVLEVECGYALLNHIFQTDEV